MIYLQENLKLINYTLILPSVSVGNVGQLSIDLLISTLHLRRAGRIFHTCLMPTAGADPYELNEDICSSVDLYVSDERKIVVIQIRSPIIKKALKFFYEILNFVIDHEIAKVIILTSSFGHENRDEEIQTAPFRYLITKNVSTEFRQQFEDLSWIDLELKLLDEFNGEALQIYGGGFAKIIFELFQKNNIICIILLKFCSEGDNIPDAIELINYFNCYLQLIPIDKNHICKLEFPLSWKFLFGNSPPRDIY